MRRGRTPAQTLLLLLLGCHSASTAVDKDAQTDPYPSWDSGSPPTDSHDPLIQPEVPTL